MRFASTSVDGGAAGYTGKFYESTRAASTMTQKTLPTGVEGVDLRPSMFRFRDRSIFCGQWSRPLVRTRYATLHPAGVLPPRDAPTLGAATTGSVTGECIGRLVFAHLIGDNVIQRSNPGPASSTLSLSSHGRAWSGIPTTAADARVTHVEGYVSVDGGVSRRAWIKPLGVSSVTEAIDTATLAGRISLPVKTAADGSVSDDTAARGVPPYAVFGCRWHNRAWYIDPIRPGILYSRINEPESVDPTSFIATKGGEYPTGVGYLGNELCLFTQAKTYIIKGYGLSDFEIDDIEGSPGCISPWGIINIRGMLMFPSEEGICAYFGGGSFRNLMAFSRRNDWVSHYDTYPGPYENMFAGHSARTGEVLFNVRLATSPKTFTWKGYYRPMIEEGFPEPYWTNNIQARDTSCFGSIYDEGERRARIAYGACDGYIRQDDPTDDDDDGDTYQKKMVVRHKHFFFGDQTGDIEHGRHYTGFDWFGKNENDDVTVNLYAGDDEAGDGTASKSVTIAQPSATAALGSLQAKTSHQYGPLVGVSGKGLTLEVEVTAPVGVEHRGFAVRHKEGSQVRGRA